MTLVRLRWEYRNSTDEKDSSEPIRLTNKVKSRPPESSCAVENIRCEVITCVSLRHSKSVKYLLALFSFVCGGCDFFAELMKGLVPYCGESNSTEI